MTEPTAPKRPRRKRLLLCIKAIALIVIFIVAAIAARHIYCHFRIKSQFEAIRKAGYPVTLSELNDWYPTPPPGQNAADVLLEAFSKYDATHESDELPISGPGTSWVPPLGRPRTEEATKLISRFLADNASALELLHRGAAMPQCRYPVDFTVFTLVNVPLEHNVGFRRGGRILKLEAIMRAEAGNGVGAAQSVQAILGLARTVANEPAGISHGAEIALLAIATDSLERILLSVSLADPEMDQLLGALEEADKSPGLVRSIAGDRCVHAQSLLYPDAWLRNCTTEIRMTLQLNRLLGGMDKELSTYLELAEKYLQAAREPLPDRLEHGVYWEGRAERLRGRYLSVMTLCVILDPGSVLKEDARNVAKLRATRCALAVERYRLANGNLPDALGEVVPKFMEALPEDPFDGKPVRYRKLDKGYVVYSVGPDRKDDSGAKIEYYPETPSDVAFTVAR